jgi:hemolysin activation/secretion protein
LPTDVDRFQYYALSHSTPIGSEGLRLGASVGYLRTKPRTFPIRGEAKSAGLTLSYPLKRGYQENLYLSLGLDGINSDNALFGQLIASDHTRAIRGSVSWSRAKAVRSISALLTASRGLDILAAKSDSFRTELGFTKVNGQFGLNQMIGKQFVIRLTGTGQLSEDRLPASEQFTLGGDTIGRAFPGGYVVGDKGYGLSAELAWANGSFWPGIFKGSEIYVFADQGEVWTTARYLGLLPSQRYDLASAGGGVRVNYSAKIVIGLEAARSLELPYAGTTKGWRYVISWRSLI